MLYVLFVVMALALVAAVWYMGARVRWEAVCWEEKRSKLLAILAARGNEQKRLPEISYWMRHEGWPVGPAELLQLLDELEEDDLAQQDPETKTWRCVL